MRPPLARLLEETLAAARRQLAAARALDARALRVATERRQDLLFQLRLVEPTREEVSDPEVRRLADELRAVDRRIAAVAEAGERALSVVLPAGPPPVYTADGRLRGGAA